MGSLPAIARPDGRLYRPRKLRMIGFDDYYDEAWVAVIGTHDIELAEATFQRGFQGQYLVEPYLGWVRDTIRDGERYIDCDDPVRGAAAVIFRESDDPPVRDGDQP